MADLLKFLSHNSADEEINQNFRIIMRKILRDKLKKEVIMNKLIKSDKIMYLMTSKIYALRCSSRDLTTRLQYR